MYEVRAIEMPGNPHILDIKAIVDGKRLPVKVVVSEERYAPVQALTHDGRRFEVFALSADGTRPAAEAAAPALMPPPQDNDDDWGDWE